MMLKPPSQVLSVISIVYERNIVHFQFQLLQETAHWKEWEIVLKSTDNSKHLHLHTKTFVGKL